MSPTRKGIAVTRSFGRPVTLWPDMREACAHRASRAGEKLRAEGLVAARTRVFLHTNPHAPDEPWHSAQYGGRIEPTDDTRNLIVEAVRMLAPVWRPGHRYVKRGVILEDLRDRETQPRTFFRHGIRSNRRLQWGRWIVSTHGTAGARCAFWQRGLNDGGRHGNNGCHRGTRRGWRRF